MRPPTVAVRCRSHAVCSEAQGPCLARSMAQALWSGQEYVLSIDSHTRFAPGYDETLIKWHGECESSGARPIITCYPPPYEQLGDEGHTEDEATQREVASSFLVAKCFDDDGMLRIVGKPLMVPLKYVLQWTSHRTKARFVCLVCLVCDCGVVALVLMGTANHKDACSGLPASIFRARRSSLMCRTIRISPSCSSGRKRR